MVAGTANRVLLLTGEIGDALLADGPLPPLPHDRSALLVISLLAIVLLGAFLVLVILYGARIVRKRSSKRLPSTHIDEDDWYRKPLVHDDQEESIRDSE